MSDEPEPTMVELFQYNHWANQELMAICMGLSDEMLTASNPGSYGSIRETFAHILKAEISFLKRIHGTYPEPDFRWEDNPSLYVNYLATPRPGPEENQHGEAGREPADFVKALNPNL